MPLSWVSRALGLSLVVSLAACEIGARTVGYEPIDSVEPGVERELTRGAPCDFHAMRTASDPAGSVAVFVSVQGAEHGEELAPTYEVVDPEVHVWLHRGSNLFSDACNRIDDWGAPEIEEDWEAPQNAAQHGTIEIDLDPDAPLDSIQFATVTLYDVSLHREDADAPEIVIEELVFPR